jgi:hypothetical protein
MGGQGPPIVPPSLLGRGVAVLCHTLAHHVVHRGREIVDAGGIDPGVIELEQRADGDRVIERFVAPAGRFGCVDVFLAYLGRVGADRIEQAEQRAFPFGARRRSIVVQNGIDECSVPEQRRRGGGMRAYSERALIAARGKGRDQLAHPWRQLRLAAQHGVCKARKMIGPGRFVRQQVADLRHRHAGRLGLPDQVGVHAAALVRLDIAQVHRVHQMLLNSPLSSAQRGHNHGNRAWVVSHASSHEGRYSASAAVTSARHACAGTR